MITKGQIKPKADWHTVDSPKKGTNEFVLLAFLLFMANKTNLLVRLLGESTARCFWFYLIFSKPHYTFGKSSYYHNESAGTLS